MSIDTVTKNIAKIGIATGIGALLTAVPALHGASLVSENMAQVWNSFCDNWYYFAPASLALLDKDIRNASLRAFIEANVIGWGCAWPVALLLYFFCGAPVGDNPIIFARDVGMTAGAVHGYTCGFINNYTRDVKKIY